MNISHTCCVSLVGSDLGLGPGSGKHECRIKHSSNAVTKNFILSCQALIKMETLLAGPEKPSQGFEPEPLELWWNYSGCSGLMSAGAQVMRCGFMDMDGVGPGQAFASLKSSSCLVIASRFLLSLSTLSRPHPLQFFCLRVSVQPRSRVPCREALGEVLMHGSSCAF